MEGQTAAAPAGSTARTAVAAGLRASTVRSLVTARYAASISRIPSTPTAPTTLTTGLTATPYPLVQYTLVTALVRANFGKPSPDTEEIRLHLLDIVTAPEEHTDGYPFFSSRPHIKAIEQLVDFGDHRVVQALEDLARRDEVEEARSDILELINTVRQRLAG